MKKILFSSQYIPPEWIAAHGFEPIREILGQCKGFEESGEGICPYAELQRLSRFLISIGGHQYDLDKLIGLFSDKLIEKPAPLTSVGRKIAIMGGPAIESDTELFQLITVHGGDIALDAKELGEISWPAINTRELAKKPFEELAAAWKLWRLPPCPIQWPQVRFPAPIEYAGRLRNSELKQLLFPRFPAPAIAHLKEKLSVILLKKLEHSTRGNRSPAAGGCSKNKYKN